MERQAEEVARLAGETKTEAVRKALEMRLRELQRKRSFDRVIRFLEEEVWPQIPPELFRKGLSKEEEEEILGYGKEGH
ncbi:type II toxin-antitoxin system VapB family antitoxin [Flavobacteriaceae bacterium MHTCC 0001]